jgi:hypothetical protein
MSAFVKLEAKENDFGVFANFGIMATDDLKFNPFFWYFGGNFDFYVSDNIIISPEANLIMQDFEFETFLLQPAIILNVKLSSLFVGAGIQKVFRIGGEETFFTDLGLKLNAGFRSENIKFTFFATMPFDSILKDMLIGVQIGLGF